MGLIIFWFDQETTKMDVDKSWSSNPWHCHYQGFEFQFAWIKEVKCDTSGTERYYVCEYKFHPPGMLEVGTKFKSVTRSAQSLCLILTKKEPEENKIVDSLMFLDLQTDKVERKKVNVKVDIGPGNIINVWWEMFIEFVYSSNTFKNWHNETFYKY